MGHGHPEDGELVGLASQRAAGGHHVGQLCDIGCHLVAAPALDFAVVLPAVGSKDKQKVITGILLRDERGTSIHEDQLRTGFYLNNSTINS